MRRLKWYGTVYDVFEVSEYLTVAPVTVRRWIQRGQLRAAKLGRSYMILERDLQQFLRNQFDASQTTDSVECPIGLGRHASE